MRGKVWGQEMQTQTQGITPAYAGKSVFVSSGGLLFWDHPRLCGEKSAIINIPPKFMGSPPPMRGKAIMYFCWSMRTRITPAYAGKSKRLEVEMTSM